MRLKSSQPVVLPESEQRPYTLEYVGWGAHGPPTGHAHAVSDAYVRNSLAALEQVAIGTANEEKALLKEEALYTKEVTPRQGKQQFSELIDGAALLPVAFNMACSFVVHEVETNSELVCSPVAVLTASDQANRLCVSRRRERQLERLRLHTSSSRRW